VQPFGRIACCIAQVQGASDIDQELLRSVYERFYRPLVRMCALIVSDRATAEDIVQDVFVRGAARISHLEPDNIAAYLRRGIANECRNRSRHQAVKRRVHPRLVEVPTGATTTSEDRDEMWSLIVQLPFRQRACLVLRYYEDLSERETAAALGCSAGTVKSQTSRALRTLRRRFE
jgi:RNA polymerase sigma-70 factor (sigma-E family)